MLFIKMADPPSDPTPVIPPTSTAPDIDPPLPEDNTDLSEIEKEVLELEIEQESLENYSAFGSAYYAHGDDPALNAMGIKLGYLQGTAMAAYGLEAINDESIVYAQEGIASAIKNKVGEWISKIGPTLTATSKAVWNFVKKQFDRISSLVEAAASGVKNTVKAHPFATVAATVAACLGLGAVAPAMFRAAPALMGSVGRMGMAEAGAAKAAAGAAKTAATAVNTASKSGAIAAEATQTASKLNGIVSAIKWPFAKFSISKPVGGSFKLVKEGIEGIAPMKKASSALGWTSASVKALGNKLLSGLRSVIPNLTELAVKQYQAEVATIKAHWAGGKYFRLAGNIGMNILAIAPFLGLIWSVIKAFFSLIKEIVWGTCRIVITTFQALVDGKHTDDDTAEQTSAAQGG